MLKTGRVLAGKCGEISEIYRKIAPPSLILARTLPLVLGPQGCKNKNLKEGSVVNRRSLKTYCFAMMIIAVVLFSASGAWAYENAATLGASLTATEKGIDQNYFFSGSFLLETPSGQPLAFWGSTNGLGAICPKGLPFKIGVVPVGFKNLLSVEIRYNTLDTNKEQWLPMQLLTGGEYSYCGNTNEFPTGPCTITFRMTHKDDRGVTRILFFKFVTMKEGKIDSAVIVNVQEADGLNLVVMSREEIFNYLRGFIPAWATPLDPVAAEQMREQRERKTAQMEEIRQAAVEESGSVMIRLFNSQETPVGGPVTIKVTDPGGKVVLNETYMVSSERPLIVRKIQIGSTISVRPPDASNWFSKNIGAPGEIPINLKKRGN